MDNEANTTERRRWNDPYWARVWPKREQLTGAVTELLLDSAHLSVGQTVLDIGSGAGIATIEAERRVGPTGFVLGADISFPLVEFAIERAEQAGLDNVGFIAVDVQTDALDGAPFDTAISQFGVMFFDAPTQAFENIRRQLVPGGRLSFVCWQPFASNPWHLNHAVSEFVPPPRAIGPTPGPFGLGDPAYATALLRDAGWQAIERSAIDLDVTVDRDAIVDDDQLAFIGIPKDQLDAATLAVNNHLAKFQRAEGGYDVTLAIQIFTCTA
jgi:SAM-dependent methyltransferase